MSRRFVALSGLCLAGALAMGCSDTKPEKASAAPLPIAVPSAAKAPETEEGVLATGPVVVENQVDVLAQRDGMIASLNADLGTPVRKGQTLATIDDRQVSAQRDAQAAKVNSITADLKNWEALLKVKETERDRAEQMWKNQLITQQDREKAGYNADAAKFEVERQREDLKEAQAALKSLEVEAAKSRIVAPFDGVVARRYVNPGQKVTKDDKLFWVSATGPMRVRFMMPERYLSSVRAGTELAVFPAVAVSGDKAGPEYRAKVFRLSPVVDASSGTIEAIAEITGPHADLRPGMTVKLKLAAKK